MKKIICLFAFLLLSPTFASDSITIDVPVEHIEKVEALLENLDLMDPPEIKRSCRDRCWEIYSNVSYKAYRQCASRCGSSGPGSVISR